MLKTEIEREDGGRWVAEIPAIPGVMVYGRTKRRAIAKVAAPAQRVVIDRRRDREAARHR
jgi:predicted RNase H-like HicB family nuclease